MPLHLLGKKSWNVYSPANIARVKQDEAAARAQHEAEEKRRQELDAERRLAILRGEVPPSLPPSPNEHEAEPLGQHDTTRKRSRNNENGDDTASRHRDRRKRKRFGEDDTDFEMRVAREREQEADPNRKRSSISVLGTKTSNAPLVDKHGHIALFPEDEGHPTRGQKNEEAERETAAKRREYEDQYTMRFSNAAGRNSTGSGPWYTSKASGSGTRDGPDDARASPQAQGKDVWGNHDPKRRDRDAARVVANDPLAMMKQGAAKAREVAKERRVFDEERARELHQLRKDESRRGKRRRRRHHDVDELEGFTLDGQYTSNGDDDTREKKKHRHREPHSDSRIRDNDTRRDKDRHHHHHGSNYAQRDYDHGRYENRHQERPETSSHHRPDRSRGDREERPESNRRKSARTDNY